MGNKYTTWQGVGYVYLAINRIYVYLVPCLSLATHTVNNIIQLSIARMVQMYFAISHLIVVNNKSRNRVKPGNMSAVTSRGFNFLTIKRNCAISVSRYHFT